MQPETTQTPPSEEVLKQLTERFGMTFTLKIPLDDSGDKFTFAILKKPTRTTLAAVMGQMAANPMAAYETLLRDCIIPEHSDMSIIDEDDLFLSAMGQLDKIIKIRKAELKKN